MSKGPNTPSQPGGGGPLTPSSTAGMEMPPKYTGGPNTPNTPNSDMNFPVPSPSQNPDKHRMTPSSQPDSKFPAPSPGQASTGPRSPMVSNRFPVPSPGQRFPGPGGPMGPGPGGPGRPSSTGGMSPMHDAPLNPSAASTMGRGFDPISSMAQMSQQLTSTSSANTGPPGGPPDLCNMVNNCDTIF